MRTLKTWRRLTRMGVFLRKAFGPPAEVEVELQMKPQTQVKPKSALVSIQRASDAAEYLGEISRMTIEASGADAARRPQAIPVNDEFDRTMARLLGRITS